MEEEISVYLYVLCLNIDDLETYNAYCISFPNKEHKTICKIHDEDITEVELFTLSLCKLLHLVKRHMDVTKVIILTNIDTEDTDDEELEKQLDKYKENFDLRLDPINDMKIEMKLRNNIVKKTKKVMNYKLKPKKSLYVKTK